MDQAKKKGWTHWAVLMSALLFGGGLAHELLSQDCCTPGAACCHPGSPCCAKHHEPKDPG